MSSPELWAETLTGGDGGDGTPIFVLHGFTGSAATMAPLAAELGPGPVIGLDLPGHGRSPSPDPEDPSWSVEGHADLVARRIRDLSPGPVGLVGYSFGGRVALTVTRHHPEVVAALVTVGASPGIPDPGERARRRESDEGLARLIEDRGLTAFVDHWMGLPMWESLRRRRGERWWEESRRQRLDNRPGGLATSLRRAGTGSMAPLAEHLDRMSTPTLLLAGAEDHRYVDLAGETAAALPGGWAMTIPHSGHAAHLEQPALCAAAIRCFLDYHR